MAGHTPDTRGSRSGEGPRFAVGAPRGRRGVGVFQTVTAGKPRDERTKGTVRRPIGSLSNGSALPTQRRRLSSSYPTPSLTRRVMTETTGRQRGQEGTRLRLRDAHRPDAVRLTRRCGYSPPGCSWLRMTPAAATSSRGRRPPSPWARTSRSAVPRPSTGPARSPLRAQRACRSPSIGSNSPRHGRRPGPPDTEWTRDTASTRDPPTRWPRPVSRGTV